jgi:hypothetical protein
MNGLLLTLTWLVASLAAWFVVSAAAALLLGKSIHLADERQAHPEPESLRDAA